VYSVTPNVRTCIHELIKPYHNTLEEEQNANVTALYNLQSTHFAVYIGNKRQCKRNKSKVMK